MLETVTVTGADDSVRSEELINLAREFPYAEFGILCGNHPGSPRFPTGEWKGELCAQASYPGKQIFLSAHLCGNFVNAFLAGSSPIHFSEMFGRIQVNTHGQPHAYDVETVRSNVRKANLRGQQVIFQYDRVNTNALLCCIGRHVTDRYANLGVSALYDLSHGEGRLPLCWEKPLPGVYCGYAGGLSPDNVVAQVEQILRVTGDNPFWIDVETHLRSDKHGDVFDLDKVVKFLEAVRPYARKIQSL